MLDAKQANAVFEAASAAGFCDALYAFSAGKVAALLGLDTEHPLLKRAYGNVRRMTPLPTPASWGRGFSSPSGDSDGGGSNRMAPLPTPASWNRGFSSSTADSGGSNRMNPPPTPASWGMSSEKRTQPTPISRPAGGSPPPAAAPAPAAFQPSQAPASAPVSAPKPAPMYYSGQNSSPWASKLSPELMSRKYTVGAGGTTFTSAAPAPAAKPPAASVPAPAVPGAPAPAVQHPALAESVRLERAAGGSFGVPQANFNHIAGQAKDWTMLRSYMDRVQRAAQTAKANGVDTGFHEQLMRTLTERGRQLDAARGIKAAQLNPAAAAYAEREAKLRAARRRRLLLAIPALAGVGLAGYGAYRWGRGKVQQAVAQGRTQGQAEGRRQFFDTFKGPAADVARKLNASLGREKALSDNLNGVLQAQEAAPMTPQVGENMLSTGVLALMAPGALQAATGTAAGLPATTAAGLAMMRAGMIPAAFGSGLLLGEAGFRGVDRLVGDDTRQVAGDFYGEHLANGWDRLKKVLSPAVTGPAPRTVQLRAQRDATHQSIQDSLIRLSGQAQAAAN